MNRETIKKIREHKVTQVIVTVLPWIALAGVCMGVYLRENNGIERNFIAEDYWYHSSSGLIIRTNKK